MYKIICDNNTQSLQYNDDFGDKGENYDQALVILVT